MAISSPSLGNGLTLRMLTKLDFFACHTEDQLTDDGESIVVSASIKGSLLSANILQTMAVCIP